MFNDLFSLKGRVALVTGGSRGIGKAIGLRLATQGADVAFSYKGNQPAAKATAGEIEALGRRAVAVQGDVSDVDAADGVVKAAHPCISRQALVSPGSHK